MGDDTTFTYDVDNSYDFIVWGTTRLTYGVTIGGQNGFDGTLTITNMETGTAGPETVIIQSDIDRKGLQTNIGGKNYNNTELTLIVSQKIYQFNLMVERSALVQQIQITIWM